MAHDAWNALIANGLPTEPVMLPPELAAEWIATIVANHKAGAKTRLPYSGAKIHYTKLTPSTTPGGLSMEWNTFVRELGRLLAEGNEGRHVLIKGDQVIGLWDTFDEACAEGRRRFPGQDIAVQPVSEWQPLVKLGHRGTWAV